MRADRSFLCHALALLLPLALLPSCRPMFPHRGEAPSKETPLAPGSYARFVAETKGYPLSTVDIFRDKELMRQASAESPIYICLSQQRGRLYVHGQVAADFPVSTGIDGHRTPVGAFTIREKKKAYSSNRYGKFLDAEGKCVNGNADNFTEKAPEGGKFVGAPMPNWMRLTGDGIGMHTGKVRAGRRLSHGCIRLPQLMASQLFEITGIGTRVTVCQAIEPCYPADALRLLAGSASSRPLPGKTH